MMQIRNTGSKELEYKRKKIADLMEEIEAMEEGVCVIGYDGKIVGINTAFEELTGYTRDELIGRSPLEVHPERERERIIIRLKECLEKQSTSGLETVFLRKDKRTIPMRVEFDIYPR